MVRFTRLGPAPVSPLAIEESVRMRDGVALAADVYLPEGRADPGDAVLIRLPYDKSGPYTFIPQIADYFMRAGYRVIAQDVRGKFRSEGRPLLFVNEAQDGADTLDWIVEQPWSNGRIAMWGDSYYGYTQWAAASTGHPALKAIAPRVTGTGLGEPVVPREGESVRDVERMETLLYPVTHFHSADTFQWDLDWDRREFAAQVEEFLAEVGRRSPSYDQWYPHPVVLPRFAGDDAFTCRPVPVLHTIGWWDNCSPESWADVERLRSAPAWDALHYVRIEPMDHENHYWGEPEEYRVEEHTEEQIAALLPRMLDPALEFFEVFVRGNGSPHDIPRVLWNLAGTDEWRDEDAWPPRGSIPRTLTARASGTLVGERHTGHVVDEESTVLVWTHDPENLVPSSVRNPFAYLLESPDEAPLGDREDVLVFTSEPLPTDLDVAGPVVATATVSSDGPVMDVFVKLLDLSPDGGALRIARGQIQLRDTTAPVRVGIDLGQVGYRIPAGHRLLVHLASSDYPEFVPQPGTGEDPWAWGPTRTNIHTLDVGGSDGFRLTLPILRGELP